jgi:hypothetical protein
VKHGHHNASKFQGIDSDAQSAHPFADGIMNSW